MTRVVLVSDAIEGNPTAARAARERLDALASRLEDLVVVAHGSGNIPGNGTEKMDPAEHLRQRVEALDDPASTVVVIDGGIDLLSHMAVSARDAGARVLWSADSEPSAETAALAAVWADGALVASTDWFPRRLGVRLWVVRNRAQHHARVNDAADHATEPQPDVADWPPSPDEWADRVVQAAMGLAPAPVTAAMAVFDSELVASRALPRLVPGVGDGASQRRTLLLGAAAVAAVVVGLVIAASTGYVRPVTGNAPQDPQVGIETNGTANPRTAEPSPGTPQAGPDVTTPSGRTQSAGTPARSTGTGTGSTNTGSRNAGSAASPTTTPNHQNPTTPPATTPKVTTPPTTTPKVTTPPVTTPPVTTPPVTTPPVTTPPVTTPPVTTPPVTTPKATTPTTSPAPPISIPRLPIFPFPIFP